MKAITVEIAKLSLKPGDVLVIRSDTFLSPASIAGINEVLLKTLPEGTKTLVIDRGLTLQVVSQECN